MGVMEPLGKPNTPLVRSDPARAVLLCNIDLLRGIAAIIILFWHYQHFYYPRAGSNPIARGELPRSAQPLFEYLSWFYTDGALAVHFFWILSGFIFFHVYRSRENIFLKDFFMNRFSRLYPLHFLSLIIVMILQEISLNIFGHHQIYPLNDFWHFLLNILMASHWGFQSGYSFNAPIWSISVEILTYSMFFAFLKGFGLKLFSSVMWLGWALIIYKNATTPIFECLALFALGGVLNQCNEYMVRRGLVTISVIASIFTVVASLSGIYGGWLGKIFGLKWFVFPSLIWTAAALESRGLSVGKIGVELGKLSYSSYLIHVPVQIALIMLLDGLVGSRDLVSSPAFLAAFISGVLVLSAIIFCSIERPLQRMIRGYGRAPRKTSASPALGKITTS